jgi:hypothetical protein
MAKYFAILLLIGAAAAGADQVTDVQNISYWLCKHQKEVRTIRVHLEDGGCATLYSKQGTERRIGSGKNQGSCMGFLNNVKTNLEKSNWTCRDISSSHMTASLQ